MRTGKNAECSNNVQMGNESRVQQMYLRYMINDLSNKLALQAYPSLLILQLDGGGTTFFGLGTTLAGPLVVRNLEDLPPSAGVGGTGGPPPAKYPESRPPG